MEKIITDWLNENYNTEMFGPPTWEMLVKAVRAPTGGNNNALANKIAKAHKKKPVSCSHAGRKTANYQ